MPEARIAVAHGQMDEGTLEQVVVDFWEGRYDVLVCTTIIESGIDMPTVNTLVVERADLLGLGQMHQLRGRVGRSGQRAYAYLFHPEDRVLTEEAYERLKTIGEATELGSRASRSRCATSRSAVPATCSASRSRATSPPSATTSTARWSPRRSAEMKGEPVKQPAEIKLDVPTDAYLPADYVTKEELRLEAYRRLADVTTQAEVDDIRTEWEDRYGPLPDPAEALLTVGRLRAECHRLGITEMQITGSKASRRPGAAVAARTQAVGGDAAEAPVEGCDPQGRPAPARRTDPPRPRPRPRSSWPSSTSSSPTSRARCLAPRVCASSVQIRRGAWHRWLREPGVRWWSIGMVSCRASSECLSLAVVTVLFASGCGQRV